MSTLRERIAALQQRSTSPSSSAQNKSAKYPGLSVNEGRGLKDKIANFEKRGGTPVPRSSFGLAPPSTDKPTSREMYGNRFVNTPMPMDPTLSRSSSTRSPSPNTMPSQKRERRISSYGDANFNAASFAHRRSYSTAGDKLIPMHTGTTSSDEVSSVTSSFPATPHDNTQSYSRLDEFEEDPERYVDDDRISVIADDTPSKRARELSPEVFRKAFDKFSQPEPEELSPIRVRKKSTTLVRSPVKDADDQKIDRVASPPPNIVVNETVIESPVAASLNDLHIDDMPTPAMVTSEANSPASPETVRSTPAVTPKWDEEHEVHRGFMGSAVVQGRVKIPSRSNSPCPSPVSSPRLESLSRKASEASMKVNSFPPPPPIPEEDQFTRKAPSLCSKKSQQSVRKLTPLKPPERPISMGLSTPDIMAQFPAVPASSSPASPAPSSVSAPGVAEPISKPVTNSSVPFYISRSRSTTASSSQTKVTIISSTKPSVKPASITTSLPPPEPQANISASSTKSNPKSTIPGWWDYNSDDEEVGGWANVVVTTTRR